EATRRIACWTVQGGCPVRCTRIGGSARCAGRHAFRSPPAGRQRLRAPRPARAGHVGCVRLRGRPHAAHQQHEEHEMATRKRTPKPASQQQAAVDSAYLNSDSAPATPPRVDARHPALARARAVGETVDAMPHNVVKPAEYGRAAAIPPVGETVEPPTASASASSLSEKNASAKTGGPAKPGVNAAGGELPRVRADSGGQAMTTNQGVPLADNQSSLKAGLRGP